MLRQRGIPTAQARNGDSQTVANIVAANDSQYRRRYRRSSRLIRLPDSLDFGRGFWQPERAAIRY
jgi:hypothetical protein